MYPSQTQALHQKLTNSTAIVGIGREREKKKKTLSLLPYAKINRKITNNREIKRKQQNKKKKKTQEFTRKNIKPDKIKNDYNHTKISP